MDSDPKQALLYAQKATTLGDTASKLIEATIHDLHPQLDPTQHSFNRLQTISTLISKLDPVYAFNTDSHERIRTSGFITHLSGEYITHLYKSIT